MKAWDERVHALLQAHIALCNAEREFEAMRAAVGALKNQYEQHAAGFVRKKDDGSKAGPVENYVLVDGALFRVVIEHSGLVYRIDQIAITTLSSGGKNG